LLDRAVGVALGPGDHAVGTSIPIHVDERALFEAALLGPPLSDRSPSPQPGIVQAAEAVQRASGRKLPGATVVAIDVLVRAVDVHEIGTPISVDVVDVPAR